jgi:peptidoglycan/xylan/chitin deacetylase (PgdA/CDA1 family)
VTGTEQHACPAYSANGAQAPFRSWKAKIPRDPIPDSMRVRERLFPHWIWRLPNSPDEIALTFDDGPNPHSTPALISSLHKLQIPATLFLIGEHCAREPKLTRDLRDSGCSIAVHAYTHQSFLWRAANWQRESIKKTARVLADNGVDVQPLFRPPYGHFNAATPGVLANLGFQGVLWSQILSDWRPRSPSQLEKRLLSGLTPGSIIVLHDQPENLKNLLYLLPRLRDEAERRRWRFRAIVHPRVSPSTHQ